MVQPENFMSSDSKSILCKLKKSIYGPKQASHQWYYQFHEVITSYDFKANVVDDYVYHNFNGSKYIFLVLYVDDILLASNNMGLLHKIKRFLTKSSKMKDLGEAFFVFDLKDSKLGDTPIAKGDKFNLKQCPDNERIGRQKILYSSTMGSLMYTQVS